MPQQRDNFSRSTLGTLAKRVGFCCSNPGCKRSTTGPHTDSNESVNIGVGAHISAAAIGGPRYKSSLSVTQRKSADNGIWLCQVCAKLIDNDVARYTITLLQDWKSQAEEAAEKQLQTPTPSITDGERITKRIEQRQRINSWRLAISNERYDLIDSRSDFLSSAIYSSLRPHLLPDTVRMIEAPRTFYIGGARGDKVRKYTLLDEISRLEREWGL